MCHITRAGGNNSVGRLPTFAFAVRLLRALGGHCLCSMVSSSKAALMFLTVCPIRFSVICFSVCLLRIAVQLLLDYPNETGIGLC